MFSLDKKIRTICDQAIILSGGARSGTTILGNILHSLKNVEYAFEPPMLFSLLPLLDTVPKNDWQLLYETYLYEELLMNALAGRNINCNRADDSSIFKVKNITEIEARQNRSWRKTELEKIASQKSTIAYKAPDITPYLPHLQKYYPGTRVVIALRNAHDTLHSLAKKGWLSDTSLKYSNQLWPNTLYKGFKIPYFVARKDFDQFIRYDELHRLAYYYLQTNSHLKNIKNVYFVHYEDLTANPKNTIKKMADHLGLAYGPKTISLIKDVRLRPEDRTTDLVGQLENKLRSAIQKLDEQLARL